MFNTFKGIKQLKANFAFSFGYWPPGSLVLKRGVGPRIVQFRQYDAANIEMCVKIGKNTRQKVEYYIPKNKYEWR